MQINQYPNEAVSLVGTDLFDIDKDMGAGVWLSHKLKFSTLITEIGANSTFGENIGNTNLVLTNNRVLDCATNLFWWKNVSTFTAESGSSPSLGNASFNWIGYGTTVSDITHRLQSSAGVTQEWYGDNSSRMYGGLQVDGNIGVGTASVSGRRIYGIDSGSDIGVYMQTNNGIAGYFNSTNYRGIEVVGKQYGAVINNVSGDHCLIAAHDYALFAQGTNYGVFGSSQSGVAGMFTTSSGLAIQAEGKVFARSVGFGEATDASAILQVGSTSQGFAPPRMTYAQMSAIPSPMIGLMVYATDSVEGLYVNTSGGWTLIS